MKRRGFTLMELLLLLGPVTAVALVSGPLLKALLCESARSSEVVAGASAAGRMVVQLRRDVESARSLPRRVGEIDSDERRLLIESTEGTLCYVVEDDRVVREVLDAAGRIADPEPKAWRIHNAMIRWSVLRRGEDGYAVEVQTGVGRVQSGRMQKKMANSHVFFVSAAGRARP